MEGLENFSANFLFPHWWILERTLTHFSHWSTDGKIWSITQLQNFNGAEVLSYAWPFAEIFTVVNCMWNLKYCYSISLHLSHACPFYCFKFMLNSQCFQGLSKFCKAGIKISKVASFAKYNNPAMPLKGFYFYKRMYDIMTRWIILFGEMLKFSKNIFAENEVLGRKIENLSDLGQGYLFSTWNLQNQLIIPQPHWSYRCTTVHQFLIGPEGDMEVIL